MILSILLLTALFSMSFITVKYIHTVRSFNTFYAAARETALTIDSETEQLETQITALEEDIASLNSQLESVTAERDDLAQKLSGLS